MLFIVALTTYDKPNSDWLDGNDLTIFHRLLGDATFRPIALALDASAWGLTILEVSVPLAAVIVSWPLVALHGFAHASPKLAQNSHF